MLGTGKVLLFVRPGRALVPAHLPQHPPCLGLTYTLPSHLGRQEPATLAPTPTYLPCDTPLRDAPLPSTSSESIVNLAT